MFNKIIFSILFIFSTYSYGVTDYFSYKNTGSKNATLKQTHDHQCVSLSETSNNVVVNPGETQNFKVVWSGGWCDITEWGDAPILYIALFDYKGNHVETCSVCHGCPSQQNSFTIIENSDGSPRFLSCEGNE